LFPDFLNSKSVGNLDFSQKESLFLSNSYCTMPCFEIFGAPEVTFSYFTSWRVFEYWKIIGIWEKD
jgi:hypothetical protein